MTHKQACDVAAIMWANFERALKDEEFRRLLSAQCDSARCNCAYADTPRPAITVKKNALTELKERINNLKTDAYEKRKGVMDETWYFHDGQVDAYLTCLELIDSMEVK